MSRRRMVWGLLGALVLLGAGLLVAWQARETLLSLAIDRVIAASGGRLTIERANGWLQTQARIERLQWRDPQGLQVDLRDARWRWGWTELLLGRLVITDLTVAELRVRLGPGGGGPLPLPASLALPVPVALPSVRIEQLRIEPAAGAPLVLEALALQADYQPGDGPAAGRFRVDQLALRAPWGAASARFTLADQAPFALEGNATGELHWQGLALALGVSGSLTELRWQTHARAGPAAAQAVLTASGVLTPFAARLLGPVSWQASGLSPALLGGGGSVRQGLVEGEGDLTWLSDVPDQGVSLRLALRNRQPAPLDQGGVPVTRAQATLTWRSGLWQIAGLQAHLGGVASAGGAAQLSGDVAIDPGVRTVLPGLDLPGLRVALQVARLDTRLVDTRLPPSLLSGRLRLDERGLEVDFADATRAGLSVQAAAALAGERLVLSRLQVAGGPRLAGARVQAQGAIQRAAPWAFSLDGSFSGIDIAAVQTLAGRTLGAPLSGSLAGSWQLAGALRDPLAGRFIDGVVQVDRGSLQGQPVRARLSARVTDEQLVRLALALEAGPNRLHVDGAAGRPGDALQYRLDAPVIAPLAALAGLGSLTGAVTAHGVWRGTLEQPELSIEASASQLKAPGFSAARATLTGRLASARVSLRARATGLSVHGRSLDQGLIDLAGTLTDHTVRLELQQGRQQLIAQLDGGRAEPLADDPVPQRWRGTLRQLAVSGPLAARLRAPAALTLTPRSLELGAAVIEGAMGTIAVSRLQWRADQWVLAGEASLDRLASAAAALGVAGFTLPPEIDPDALKVSLRVALSGTSARDPSGTLQLQVTPPPGLQGTVEADLQLREGRLDGRVALALPTLALANRWIGPAWSVDGRLSMAGRVSGTVSAPRLSGDVRGDALSFEQRALGWRLGAGTLTARFDDDRLTVTGLRLHSGQQAIDTALARAAAPGAAATPVLPAGALELTGTVTLADRGGQFQLQANAARIPLGPGQRLVLSGGAAVSSRAGLLELKGQLRADEGLIELRGGDAPALPEDVEIVVAGQSASAPPKARNDPPFPGAAEPVPARSQPAGLRLLADLKIDLGEQFRVRGSGVAARLAGAVTLRGALPDAPRAFGTVRVSEGTYAAYGQQLQIERGQVVFNGALDNPVLDIIALRRNLPVEAGIALTGTVLAPRVRLSSRPDVVDAEKLSWLVLGVPLEGAQTGAQTAALQAAAASLFGGGAGGLARALGVDLLTIRSASASDSFASAPGLSGFTSAAAVPGQASAASSSAASGAAQNVMAIGKRLNSRLLITYEQGLRGVWNLLRIQYDITRRLSLRAQTGSESAMDVLYRVSFD